MTLGPFDTGKYRGICEISKPAVHGYYRPGTAGASVYGSAFNMSWPRELGVEPKVIIDAGSYDGGDSLRFRRAFPSALIVAIEADHDRAQIVRRNLINAQVTVIECAIAASTGTMNWYRSVKHGQPSASGSLYKWTPRTRAKFPTVTQFETPIMVNARTLVDICGALRIARIDVLHMDVEGATLDVLRGLGDLMPRILYSEMTDYWAGVETVDEVHAEILTFGYRELCRTDTDRLYFLEK